MNQRSSDRAASSPLPPCGGARSGVAGSDWVKVEVKVKVGSGAGVAGGVGGVKGTHGKNAWVVTTIWAPSVFVIVTVIV